MSKHWTQQTLAEELQERVSDLEKQLESYQAARVHDVDEKAWLSKRMTSFESALREIASHVGDDSQLDINAKNMRDAAREALGSQADGDCNACEGSGESAVNFPDGTEASTKTPPCAMCGGSGVKSE